MAKPDPATPSLFADAPQRPDAEPSFVPGPEPGAGDLRRDFADRDALVAYCRETFRDAAGVDDRVSPFRGGRSVAEAALDRVDPAAYGRTRNKLDGAVTRLSPYLRGGVLDLAETRDAVLEKASKSAASKLVQELAWRDFYQRVLAEVGTGVWDDLEDWKTGHPEADYDEAMPDDVARGETGIDFVDASAKELAETGYLHNQMRMKVAAYLVHWRHVHWRAGARWFLTHLLDGDEASNNLSWQWVASTFGHKPYIFNAGNLHKVSEGRFDGTDAEGHNAFAGSYDDLNAKLFD